MEKADLILEKLTTLELTTAKAVENHKVRIAQNEEDINGLGKIQREDTEHLHRRINKTGFLILGCFTALAALIGIFAFFTAGKTQW